MKPSMVIMAGGRGRRLGDLTENTPKPLVQVGGRPILQRKLEQYTRQGFRKFVLCLGYRAEQIRESVLKFDLPADFEFSDAGESAGILRRLVEARPLFGSDLLMTYGDTYTDLDLDELVRVHRQGANEATIVVAAIQNPFGLVEAEGDRVTFFKEKPVLRYYIGYAMISASALDLIPPAVVDLPDGEGLVTFFKILIALERLGVYEHSGLQITFNTKDELKAAEQNVAFYTDPEET